MSIKLKKEWVEKIVPSLIEGLQKIEVKNNMFLESRSHFAIMIADYHIPKTSPARRSLEALVDEFPLLEFVTDTVGKELYNRDKYDPDKALTSLTKIEGYDDVESLANRLPQRRLPCSGNS